MSPKINILCDICGGCLTAMLPASERMFGMGGAFVYAKCNKCRILSLVDAPRDLSDFYPGDRYYSFTLLPAETNVATRSAPSFLSRARTTAQLFGRPFWARPLAKWKPWQAVDWIKRYTRFTDWSFGLNVRVLDIGCGNGFLLGAFDAIGFSSVDGVDPFAGCVETRLNRVRIRKCEHTALTGEQFDLIILDHSLEHMPAQMSAMAGVARLLSDRGVARIELPVSDCEAFDEYGTHWVELDAPRHLHLHTRASLAKLAEKSGLRVLMIEEAGTAFEFWGSELYRRGDTLYDPINQRLRLQAECFEAADLERFEQRSVQARKMQRSGRIIMYLKKDH